ALRPDERALLVALTRKHLGRHSGDPEESLAALDLRPATREALARAGGTAVVATLARVGSALSPGANDDPGLTATYAAGTEALPLGTPPGHGRRFRVLRPPARGGLGAVFVALDTELNREVALKQIPDRHADDPTSRQRFLQEAEITGGLEHPGIVP